MTALPSDLERARAMLESGDLQRAVALLENIDDPTGTAAGLLGAAHFRLEQYGQAAVALRRASSYRPADEDLNRLYRLALANHQTDVRRRVPEPVYFAHHDLLAGPQPGRRDAAPPPEGSPRSSRSRVRLALGNAGGRVLGRAIGMLVRTLGREPRAGGTWTTWHRYPFPRAMIMLACRRERLQREQLFAAYPAPAGTAFFGGGEDARPEWVRSARTADGSWNDFDQPMAGAANTRFGFNTDPTRTTPETGPRLLTPNPRTVSRMLLTRKDGFKPVPFLNLLAAPWIQFMVHDWVSYGDPADAEPYAIPLLEDDPARKMLHQTHMLVRPTQHDPTRRPGETLPSHINEVTSWWDGSQIYGSDAETADALRSRHGGKLRVDPRTGNLPVLADGVEHTGFRRNWWLGLSMLHALFAREHNAICDRLAARHPRFTDQQLYDTARLINAAVMAKIHTVEWTPAILPNTVLVAAMNANWYGALTNALRSKKNRKTLAEINVADPIAGGLVGNAVDDHGVPYSLTREFLSVYRMHSLLPDEIARYALGDPHTPVETWRLAELRQAGSHRITDAVPMADLFYSFGRQHPGQLVLNNFPEQLQNLSIPGAGFYDLGAVDVLRDRERGTPRYNQFRRLLGLQPIDRFEELTDDVEAIAALRRVYDSVEDIDLLIGNLAEAHRPAGFGFGETLFEVFILNASRRLQADRFFTTCYREDLYTAEGLAWIDEVTLESVLLRHFPQLEATGLVNVENAFEPWDNGELDPARHPLRRFE